MNAPNAPPARLDVPDDDAAENGLGEAEAARRLATDGPDDTGRGARRGWPRILADAAREPMFLLRVVAALLYLLLGELAEGLFMSSMMAVTLGLTNVSGGQDRAGAGGLAPVGGAAPFLPPSSKRSPPAGPSSAAASSCGMRLRLNRTLSVVAGAAMAALAVLIGLASGLLPARLA